MVGWSVTCFFLNAKMDNFLNENQRGSPTLTLLNVLNVLNMPEDASLACWALFSREEFRIPHGGATVISCTLDSPSGLEFRSAQHPV